MSTVPCSVINDAVHGVISFPEKHKILIKNIIDSISFQRLRHIKQLGMIDLIFPTAVHHRFSHSIGAAYIADEMTKRLDLGEEEQRYALAGSLLHDIGHGPFSHAFEELFSNEDVHQQKKKIKHECWTECFLKEHEKILNDHDIDFRVLSDLIQKKYDFSEKKLNLVADIISSQLDADRLDYLLRDSHFCGVSYGHIDLFWIINHLTVIEENGQPPRIGVFRKGWRAVEQFLICRRIMSQNVYHHCAKNVLEELLTIFLKKLAQELMEGQHEHIIKNNHLKKFLIHAFEYKHSSLERELFIQKNFQHYKDLTDYDIWMLIRDFSNLDDTHDCSKIAQRIYRRKIHRCFPFQEAYTQPVKLMIEKLKTENNFEAWKIFITENRVTSYESEKDPILVIDEAKNVSNIECYSDILKNLRDKQEKEIYLAVDYEIWFHQEKMIREQFKKYVIFPF